MGSMFELFFKEGWVFDIETYSNCFTLVARKLDSAKYRRYAIHKDHTNIEDIMEFLSTRPVLIGYNSINFDAQVIEFLYRKTLSGDTVTAEMIYEFAQNLIERTNIDRFDTPFKEWDFSFTHVDLYRINHFDNPARFTSLKWLEFTTRQPKMADLPIPHTSTISKSNIQTILAYNRNDVDVTYEFFYKCVEMIEFRLNLVEKHSEKRILNMSDSSIGTFLFKSILNKKGIKEKKGGTKRGVIDVKNCILPYVQFEYPCFDEVLNQYRSMQIDAREGLKEVTSLQARFENMDFDFGTGGLHACYLPGKYESDSDFVIVSCDVESYYPNLAIKNRFFPEHLGESFCDIYENLFEQRRKFPKGSAINYALKILLNAVYGKSNSPYSFLYDPMYTLKITINGQLLLAMLAEMLSKVGRLIMVNTDGLEIRVPRRDLDVVDVVCKEWEKLTGLKLESKHYSKMVVRDVNNYWAIDSMGEIKRKGMFEIYEDFTEKGGKNHTYHKNPSASIIPLALNNYFKDGKPIEDTVNECDNPHEFFYGIKTQKNFEYWLLTCSGNSVEINKFSARALRYFICAEGGSLYKFFKDGRDNNIQAVNKGQTIQFAMSVKKGQEFNINRQHYIYETYKILEELNAN